ncbi:MAG: oxidoreductase, partial [Trebonia sp.]
MKRAHLGGTYALGGDLTVTRMGYGAMQLAGPMAFGPPADRAAAIAILRDAVELGITHIDTSDYYGPHATNQIIREALEPYPAGLHIVTKVGFARDGDGGWVPAATPGQLRQAVEDNLANLGLSRLDVVNYRAGGPQEQVSVPVGVLAGLREEGLIRHIGLSTVTAAQVAQAAAVAPVTCVQNMYNVGNRQDDGLIDDLAARGIAYVPYFPIGGGFAPIKSAVLGDVAARLGATP